MRAKFALRLLLLIWHQSYHTVSNSALWTSQICVCYWDYGAEIQKRESFPEKLCRFWPFYPIRTPKVLILSSIKSKKRPFYKQFKVFGEITWLIKGVIFYYIDPNISFHTNERLSERVREFRILLWNYGFDKFRL